MATNKAPERVSDNARPEKLPKERREASDVVEIAKCNAEFRKWGKFVGAFLYLRSLNAARPRSVWWRGLFGIATIAGGWMKFGLPGL